MNWMNATTRWWRSSCTDRGNVATRLVHATDETAARRDSPSRSVESNQILPNCEVAVLSPVELALSAGVDSKFARARIGAEAVTFRSKQEIVFGVGAEERVLEERNFSFFLQLAHPRSAILAILTDIASILYFAFGPGAGWNRWWSPMSA